MLTKHKLQQAYVMLMVFMASEMANAAATAGSAAGKTHITAILSSPTVGTTITVAFGLLAAFKWFEVLQNLSASSFLTSCITPAILTFMAFAWGDVLGWVGIM